MTAARYDDPIRRILSTAGDDQLLSDLLDAIPVGVVVLDDAGRVVRYNAYEQALAARSARSVIGQNFFRDVAPCTAVCDLVPAFERYARVGGPLSLDLTFQFPFPHLPVPRDVRLRLRGFETNGRRHAFLLIEDISEEVQAHRLRELLATLVAHDMKNPLAALRLNVDVALREIGEAGKGRERLNEVRFAADRLDRMIRLFLDVYRLEQSELTVTRARVDAAAVVDEVVRLQRPIADSYEVVIEVRGAAPSLEADATLLSRVIENLIDNALRHARHKIVVELGDDGPWGRIDVIDDGQGVPDDAKARIFDKFASMSADLRGYNQGLGLTFCALALDRLGGSVEALDAQPSGAIFRVLVPKATPRRE